MLARAENMTEVDDFFGELPNDKPADFLGESKKEIPEKEEVKEEIPEEGEPRKNRKHRRWESELEKRERELIAREARIQAFAEVEESRKDTGDLDPRLLRAFGTTDEGKEVTRIFSEMLRESTAKAKDEALKDIEAQQQRSVQEQKEHESFIDSNLESIEDQFNVDVTSDSPAARKARREFLELVQTLSPKDDNGSIKDYADFGATWEIYQSRRAQDKDDTTSRQKELASRSMAKSGGSVQPEADTRPMTFDRAREAISKQFRS